MAISAIICDASRENGPLVIGSSLAQDQSLYSQSHQELRILHNISICSSHWPVDGEMKPQTRVPRVHRQILSYTVRLWPKTNVHMLRYIC